MDKDQRMCIGPSWALCWVLPEGGGEGMGLVSSGDGGRGQLPVANPKEPGLTRHGWHQ